MQVTALRLATQANLLYGDSLTKIERLLVFSIRPALVGNQSGCLMDGLTQIPHSMLINAAIYFHLPFKNHRKHHFVYSFF